MLGLGTCVFAARLHKLDRAVSRAIQKHAKQSFGKAFPSGAWERACECYFPFVFFFVTPPLALPSELRYAAASVSAVAGL